jgi:negative regulator of genetic competence, sporulation and motility
VLYFYKNSYYLCFSNILPEQEKIKQLYSLISEFGTYVDNSDLFVTKLTEYGKIIMKHNAIKTCTNYFENMVNK